MSISRPKLLSKVVQTKSIDKLVEYLTPIKQIRYKGKAKNINRSMQYISDRNRKIPMDYKDLKPYIPSIKMCKRIERVGSFKDFSTWKL